MCAFPFEVAGLMTEFITWLAASFDTTHTLLLAVSAHMVFLRIHPFGDGNGRMARFILNLVLIRGGYPPIIVPAKKKEEYFRAIREWDAGNTSALSMFMYSLLEESFSRYGKTMSISFDPD
jgi:Fic family protein